MNKPFFISPAPHVKDNNSIPKIMYTVALALLPAGIGGIYFFGMNAFIVIVTAIAAALATEALLQVIMKRPVSIADGSALVTGLLVAYNVPAEVPFWLPAVGAFVGIAVGKMAFGGLGYNPLNPALIGRAFLVASWPVRMTVFQTAPRGGTLSGIESITSATPLNIFKSARDIIATNGEMAAEHAQMITQARVNIDNLYNSIDALFFGRIGGCIGETSAFLLLLGAVLLLYKRIIGWKIPFTYVGTVALLSWLFGGTEGFASGNILFHIFSGGLILGAFFMATDMTTSPVTFKGRIIFGAGCGLITVIIRLWGGYPEGVSYAILLMNLTVPLIDRYTRPKVFGGK